MKSVCSYYCTLPGPGGHHSNYTHFSRKIEYCHWFDKLIIEGNVYTYDEGTNRIVRIVPRTGHTDQPWLRSHENWFYNNTPVNVTALYTYMGLLFTPMLS